MNLQKKKCSQRPIGSAFPDIPDKNLKGLKGLITIVLAVSGVAGPLITPCSSSCHYHLRNSALVGFLLI